jgi:hypothetical protein
LVTGMADIRGGRDG